MNPEEIKAQNILKGKQAIQSIANSANTVNKVAQTAQAIQRTPIPQPSFTDSIGRFAQAVIKPFQTVSETATRIGQGLGSDVRGGLEGRPSAVLAAPKAISEYTSRVGQKIGTSFREGRPGDILTSAGSEIMGGLRTFGAGVGTATGKASDAIANTIRLSLKENKTADDYKNIAFEGLNALGATLDAPNAIFIKPVWNSIKVSIAEEMGNKIDNKQDIISGAAELSLPDLLKIDPNSPDYQAYRFLDFAPELFNIPGGGTGKLKTLAKEIKVQPGLFDDIAEDAARKFTQETGETLSKEVVDRAKQIAKDAGNVKNIAKTPGKIAKRQEITPVRQVTGEFIPSKYVKEQVKKQKEARIAGKPTITQRLKQIANEIDIKFQDFTTPINQAVNKAIKEGKKIEPTANPIMQIDRVLRSSSIASQRVKDEGLSAIIQKVDNIDEFNQYLIAKSAIELKKIKPKIVTGRNLELDKKLVEALDGKYKSFADGIFRYNRKLLLDARSAGLISGDLYNQLIKRKEYVPLNRIFSDVEEIVEGTTPRAVASLKRQTLIQRLKGSEREIVNPLESILTNTYKATAQIERNIAAKQIANLVKQRIIPGKILSKNQRANSNEIISYLDNGERVRVFVGRDIARAAQYLNKENTNILTNILQVPTRILQVGAVGLNLPFVVSNLVRDQITAAIVSGKLVRNTILNPVNFARSLFEVYGEKGAFDDFLRAGAGYSSLDITRDTAQSVRQLRAARSPIAQFSDAIRNPGEMFRALENFISKAETATRLQVFKTAREDALKKGVTPENAQIIAADAARNVTANFARRGEFGTVLNAVIPFFNATIQGSRTLRNAFVKNPAKTTALFATTIATPVAVSTLWNISDPERKAIYDQIPDYEKERNIIIIPPVITYDDRGYPFVFRIPKPQGFNQLAEPIRRLLEQSYKSIPEATLSMTNNLLSATTGFTLPTTEEGGRQLVSQFTPQLIKPGVELATGTSLFTGQRIIPMGLEKLPPQEQVKETTSFTARQIGNTLGVSPLIVENLIKTSTAGLGEQILNISDRLQAGVSQGAIPETQIGGRDPFESIVNVFYRATGGADVGRIYDDLKIIDQEKGLLNLKVKDMILKNDIEGLKSIAPELTSQQFKALERSVSEKEFEKTLSPQNKALFNLSVSQLEELKVRRPELAETIDQINQLKQDLKEKEKIDTDTFNFKETSQTKNLPKITSLKVKRPKGTRVRKAPRAPKIKIAKIKKRKPIQIKGLKKRRVTRV